MWWYLLLIPRLALALFGLYLIVLRLAGTDEAQDKAHGFLENSWAKIRELRAQALSRHTAFMRVMAGCINSGFNRIFGERLISIQSLTVSVSYASAMFFLGGFVIGLYSRKTFETDNLALFIALALAGSVMLFITSKEEVIKEKIRIIWLTAMITAAFYNMVVPFFKLTWGYLGTELDFVGRMLIFIGLGMLIGFALCSLFILVMRISMRKVSMSDSFTKIVIILLLNTLPIITLYIVWSLVEMRFDTSNWPDAGSGTDQEMVTRFFSNWSVNVDFFLIFLLVILFLFFVLFILTAAIFAVLSLLMIIHRILWPVIEKFVYGLAKNQVVRTGKFLPVIGLLFILIAWGKYAWLEKLWDKIF